MCPLKTLTGGKCSTLASKTGLNAHEKKGRVIIKRLIGILLVVLVVFGFVACDSDNPSPSGSASVKPDAGVEEQIGKVLSAFFEASPKGEQTNYEYWNSDQTKMIKDYNASNGYVILEGTGQVSNEDVSTDYGMKSSTTGNILYKESSSAAESKTMVLDAVYVMIVGDNPSFSVEKFDVTFEGKIYDMRDSKYLPSFGPQY